MPASANALASVVITLLSMVPPKSGCGCAITATARASSGCERAISILPAAPARCARVAATAMSDAQALDDAAAHEVLLDDLVDVLLVHVRVPGLLGVDHHHRSQLAAVEAAGLVDAHLALAGELELLDALLGVLLHRLGAVAGAAILGGLALVEAEEHVVLVVAHDAILASAPERRTWKKSATRKTTAANGHSSWMKRVRVAKLPSWPWGQRKRRMNSSMAL